MKFLLVTPILPPDIGGPATYVHDISLFLSSKNHHVSIVAFSDHPVSFVYGINGIKVKAIKTNHLFFGTFIRQTRLFLAILKSAVNTDLIYAQGPDVVGLMSLFVSKLLRKPLVIKYVGDLVWESAFGQNRTQKFLDDFLKNPDTGWLDKFKIKLQKLVFKKANKIIVPSNYLKNVVSRFYKIPENHIEVIYNSVPVHQSPPKKDHKSSLDEVKLITIGRLVSWKHIDQIIEAVSILKNKYKVHLTIIGDGPAKPHLEKLISNSELPTPDSKPPSSNSELRTSNFQLTGRLSHSDSLGLLKKSDIFILYSSYEGLPHTVLEAMSVHTAVIASDIPGTSEIAIDHKTALLAKPHNPADLAKKIAELIDNPKLRQNLIEQAHSLISQNFNQKVNFQKLENVLESFCHPRGGGDLKFGTNPFRFPPPRE